jgi:hypothetical protein
VILALAGVVILTGVVGAWIEKRATRRRLDAWAASRPTPSYGGSWREPGAGPGAYTNPHVRPRWDDLPHEHVPKPREVLLQEARRANELRNQAEVERLRRAEQLRAAPDDSGWFMSLQQSISSALTTSVSDSSDCGSSSDHGCGSDSGSSSSCGGSSSCASSCGSSCGGGGD